MTQGIASYLNYFPSQLQAELAQITDQLAFEILYPPMSMMHQTGVGHKQLLDAQNAKLYEGYSILIPHPEKGQLLVENIKPAIINLQK